MLFASEASKQEFFQMSPNDYIRNQKKVSVLEIKVLPIISLLTFNVTLSLKKEKHNSMILPCSFSEVPIDFFFHPIISFING